MRLFSLFLLIGTLLIQILDNLLTWQLLLIPLILAMGLLYWCKSKGKIFNRSILVAIAFFLGLSLASYQAKQILDSRISPDLEGKDLIIQGKINGIPSSKDDGIRFLILVDSAEFADQSVAKNTPINFQGTIRLGWFRTAKEIKSGELWQLRVKLKQPSGFMNPGGFDYEKWLFTQRIIATGYVRDGKKIYTVQNKKLKDSEGLKTIDYWRQAIHSFIQERVDTQSSAAVLSALLVAVRDELDERQWNLLQATGTSHLIAISGLHIAVVASFAFFPIMLLWRLFPGLNEALPVRIAGAIVGTLFAICYAMLAGFTLPTQRALLMVIIGMWGLISKRNYDATTILSFALILVLMWDPLAAMTISFWLSFLAVFLILYFIKRQKEKPRWMVIKLQIFLSLAMLPLTLLFFGSASLTSPLANLIAIPWVSLVIVPVSLVALLMMPVSTFIATQLLSFSAFMIDILFKSLALISGSALSMVSFTEVPDFLLIVAFLGLLVLILPKGFPGRWLGILLVLPILFHPKEKLKENEFTYTLLDVGQGYASVLSTQNHTLIYDTGVKVSDTFDMGKLVLSPYLKSKGIKKIDTMMISHEDIDHRGGANYLYDNFDIDQIISSDKSLFADSTACLADQKWQWDGVNFEVFSPFAGFSGNDNNRSCVLKVWNQHHSLLLTGDIQKYAERALLKSHAKQLKSEVISVPHHGSKTSSSEEFLSQVSPQIGLISAGYRSRFGHPKPSIVKRYEDAGIELLDTVNHGAISLHFHADKKAIGREYYRLDNEGFWSR